MALITLQTVVYLLNFVYIVSLMIEFIVNKAFILFAAICANFSPEKMLPFASHVVSSIRDKQLPNSDKMA